MKGKVVLWLYCGVNKRAEFFHVPASMWVGTTKRTDMLMMDRRTIMIVCDRIRVNSRLVGWVGLGSETALRERMSFAMVASCAARVGLQWLSCVTKM